MPRNYNRDVEKTRSDLAYKRSYDLNMKRDNFANRTEANGYPVSRVTRDAVTTSDATKALSSTKKMTRDNISKNRATMRKQTAKKK